MRILEKIKSLFSKREEIIPLKIHDSAIKKITSQINSRPPGIKSVFQIKLSFFPEKINYQVGFIESKDNTTIYKYSVPIFFSKTEELFLCNYTLEFDEKSENFLLYPDVTIEVEETPSPNIIRFFVNKNIISKFSSSNELAIEKKSYKNFQNVILIQRLFQKNFIESIFITNKFLSIEFNSTDNIKNKEEEVADIILKYYTDIGYELEIDRDNCKTYIPKI